MRLSTARRYAVTMHTSRRSSPIALALLSASLLAAVLTGCSPTSADTESVSGTTWGDPTAKNTPSLTFESDGKVYGTDGCNRLTGGWNEEDGTINFDTLASTMMFCEGVDDWLRLASTAQRNGDVLSVNDADGSQIGTLELHAAEG